ncbi:MAG: lipoprotein, partial [Prevotellaceae bacterium]|nr:lipoprotein [Prevotellaceae bacterium]
MKKINYLLFLAGAILLLTSCAKEVNESADAVEQRLLDAYILMNYGNTLQPTASGLYFIPEEPQHSGISPTGDDFLYMRYTIR